MIENDASYNEVYESIGEYLLEQVEQKKSGFLQRHGKKIADGVATAGAALLGTAAYRGSKINKFGNSIEKELGAGNPLKRAGYNVKDGMGSIFTKKGRQRYKDSKEFNDAHIYVLYPSLIIIVQMDVILQFWSNDRHQIRRHYLS